VEAQALWDDPHRLEIPARTQGECRWMLVGRIGPRHWFAVFTLRAETVRIISVRRARKEEVALYED